MNSRVRTAAIVACALSATVLTAKAGAQPTCQGATGPDVIVGDITGPQNYTVNGTLDALSLGTTSCNMGNENLLWNQSPANTHPVIGGNLYRYQTVNGATRFEQIGQSWLKHAFTALTETLCCANCNNQGGAVLGIGCSDPYTASRNGNQAMLGPKYTVNAHTGAYPTGTPIRPSGGNAGRLEFLVSDVTATLGGTGAAVRFFGESQYVTPDDAAAGNQNDNASYRELSVTGTTDFTFLFAGLTQRGAPAVRAWKTIDPTVTQTDVQVSGDGLYIISSKATNIGGGMWHYEYAVYNMNGDRDIGTFAVPISDAVAATNIGFSCPVYRNGDGNGNVSFSSTPWISSKTGGFLTWSTEAACPNPNANAIRWGTTYNFRFDAPAAPAPVANVLAGMWKPGTPSVFLATAQAPGLITTLPPTPIAGSGVATPASVPISGSTLLTVNVSPGTSPASTGIAVTADLSSIHGSSTQAFYDDGTHGDATAGDGTYSFLATVAEPLSPGNITIPFVVTDAQARTGGCSISFVTTAAPTGQCCAANLSCSIATAYNCTSAGGLYGGNGTTCSSPPFSSTANFPVSIPDGTGSASASVTLPAGTGNVAGNAVLTVGLSHTWVGDLAATLTHNSTTINLFSHPGGANNDNDLGGVYTFSDGGSTTFVTASNNDPIPSGTYRPLQALTAFNGQAFAGTWTFTISDNAGQDIGTINSLTVANPTPFTCPARCGSADFNCDGDLGTDSDIASFFACLSGNCPAAPCTSNADFNSDGDLGTDSDIEAFFRVLGGGTC